MNKLYLTDKKWWMNSKLIINNININKNNNDNKKSNKNNITNPVLNIINKNNNTKHFYITYQKRLMYNNNLNYIINKASYLLNDNIKRRYGIYFRYQPTILQYIQKSCK